MKTKDDLKSIAGEIYLKVKILVKSNKMLVSLNPLGTIQKDANDYYLELRTEYGLTDEENHKVDHYFFRASVIGSRFDWRHRKKEGDKDG